MGGTFADAARHGAAAPPAAQAGAVHVAHALAAKPEAPLAAEPPPLARKEEAPPETEEQKTEKQVVVPRSAVWEAWTDGGAGTQGGTRRSSRGLEIVSRPLDFWEY